MADSELETLTSNHAKSFISVVGDIYCDIIAHGVQSLPNWGEDSLCNSINLMAGGSALNTVIHGANYSTWTSSNASFQFFSAVGNDSQGELCVGKLNHNLISNNVVVRPTEKTGSCIVLSGPADRSFVTGRGCVDSLSFTWFEEEKILSTSHHLHIGGFYNCTTIREEAKEFLAKATARGITTSLGPQFDATTKWDRMVEVCPNLTLVICSESELAAMASAAAARTVEETAEAASVLLSLGCQVVVVTLGARGASAYFLNPSSSISSSSSSSGSQGRTTDDSDGVEGGACVGVGVGSLRCVHQDAPKLDSIVDATGAGDAFAGGFLVRWVALGAKGASGTSAMWGTERDPGRLSQSLRAGCEMGAAATMTLGGSSSEQGCYQRAVDLYDKP